ncbi:protein FAM151B-like [Diachasmimorpha longicaudata]|uniref:protein FAM151B-like n=1 Tax=Diachasmimorpha longicaudata TaxID=58733 RepID=UPI0030B8D437
MCRFIDDFTEVSLGPSSCYKQPTWFFFPSGCLYVQTERQSLRDGRVKRFNDVKYQKSCDFTAMALESILPFLLFAGVCCVSMAALSPDPRDFFADKIKGNLTQITWAHAVNSKQELSAALADEKIMMIEADISMGTVRGNPNETVPIMAHPPANESDLSLADFLNTTLKNPTRGIKLDFKTIEAFKASLPILKNIREKLTVPVMLNADILAGPFSGEDRPVNPDEFLQGAKDNFPESILSVGWKTQSGALPANFKGSYTKEHIQAMIDTLSKNKITQTVTFPVRATLGANDVAVMQELIKKTENYKSTLTVWSATDDFVDRQNVSTLIKTMQVGKTYVDVPENVWKELSLGSSATSLLVSATLLIVGVVISTFGFSTVM